MVKTIKIDGKDVQLEGGVQWLLVYRNQFGRDIVPVLMPLAAGLLDVLAGIVRGAGDEETLDARQIIASIDGDTLFDAMAHMSGFELTEVINVTWSLAKAADPDLPEPEVWVRQFDNFPFDEIVPKVAQVIGRGAISSKKVRQLKGLLSRLQPAKASS